MKIILDQAIDKIKRNKVVAIPTDTVYGMATKYDNHAGIEQIFALKKRPLTNPLSILISQESQLNSIVKSFPTHSKDLMTKLWPGPLTLVFPSKETVLPIVRAGLSTVAVRMPNHSTTLSLINETGPLVCPSANLSGKPSSTTSDHVEEDFGQEFPILNGEPCVEGMESTILAFNHSKWVILRLGIYQPSDFLPVLGYLPEINVSSKAECSRYKPNAKILLGLPDTTENFVAIGFSNREYPENATLFSLGSTDDLRQCKANLYSLLRKIDVEKIPVAHIDTNFSQEGIGKLLWERIKNLNN